MKNNRQSQGDLGQHWTPIEIVETMTSLLERKSGAILEPTAGSGRFVRHLLNAGYDVNAIEIDESVIPDDIKSHYKIKNFFDWEGKKFDSIIGNPPYVNGRLANVCESLWRGEIPETANLYLHVIEKCVKMHLNQGGELVFVVPSTLLSGTSMGSELRDWMVSNGSFTHFLMPDISWESAAVSACIFRWVKGQTQGQVKTDDSYLRLHSSNGMIKLIDYDTSAVLSDHFEIGVGAAPSKKFESDPHSGTSFLSGGCIKYYDVSRFKEWPRARLTNPKNKILVMPGPTRKIDVFYDTTGWSPNQASHHTDHFLEPVRSLSNESLIRAARILNDFMSRKGEMLLLRIGGRWSAGIKDLRNMPLDKETHDALNALT